MELCFYMGLLHFALGLSRTKGESPKDSYSTKPRENAELSDILYIYHAINYILFYNSDI